MIAGSMIAGLPIWLALACVGLMLIGAAVQGALGIGMGMIASPLLAIADHGFIPGAIVISVLPLSLAVVLQQHRHIDRRGAALALLGRAPGVVLGAVAAAWAGPRELALLVSGSVLIAVAASLTGVHFRPTPRALVIAGVTSGFTGTATGVGGPPMAITYQNADPLAARATLALFFGVGAVMSIVGLTISGDMGRRQLELALLLLPGVILGFAGSNWLAGLLHGDRARRLILLLCAASAIALILEEVVW
ncbi:MAG TPA: sulfite exporter TauE/SafE family protein [Ilumatobacteraceae bacterium]|nr:sulfite exporter TauE/SafE family protein [Ilumatobacteraceae bacterium]